MKKRIIALMLLFVCVFGVLIAPGCQDMAPEQRAQEVQVWKDRKAMVDAELAAKAQELEQLRAALAALPADDPVRKSSYETIVKIQASVVKGQELSSDIDKIVKDFEEGRMTPEGTLAVVRKIPVVGPYADLIALLGTSLWATWERNRRKKDTETVLDAWHNELPVGPTAAMNEAKDAIGK
ncbi:hypothetical protein BH09PLA1_BH09PLA1_25930 [soil metagenome]